jgi:hypothetical protein
MGEKLYVIKDGENLYWKKTYPFWVANINNVTPLSQEEAQDKADELERTTDKILEVLPLTEELTRYRLRYY